MVIGARPQTYGGVVSDRDPKLNGIFSPAPSAPIKKTNVCLRSTGEFWDLNMRYRSVLESICAVQVNFGDLSMG